MNKMKHIISEYVDVPEDNICESMSLQGDIGLDSFSLISMLVEIENEFNVEIPEYELKNFQTLGDMYSYIEATANV